MYFESNCDTIDTWKKLEKRFLSDIYDQEKILYIFKVCDVYVLMCVAQQKVGLIIKLFVTGLMCDYINII